MSSVGGKQNETQGDISNPFRFARYIAPIYPIHLHNPETGEYLYNENGEKIYDFGTGYSINGISVPLRDYLPNSNPAIELKDRYDQNKRNTINCKVYAEVSFLKDFKFTFNGGIGLNSYLASSAKIVYPEKGNTGHATKTNTFTTTWTFNELLTYSKDIKKHHVDILIGHESYDYEFNRLSASMKDQKFKNNYELVNYTNLNSMPSSYTNEYATEGYLSRVNYDYNGKYFASGSFRRDGSSRFYKDSRWGNFWSVGGGWRIDREKFMKNVKFIDMLKLRFSYGEVGNDDIGGYYPWRATYENSQNAEEAGYIQSSLGNTNLKWEVSRNMDIALEFSFINRIRGTFELFHRQSDNLLFSVPISPSAGITSQKVNAGTMYNKGFEFEITGDIFKKKKLSWDLSINATHIKNKITKLPVDPFRSGVHRVEEGHSRYEFYLRQWKGIDPATGNCLYIPEDEVLENEPDKLVDINGNKYTTNIEKAKYKFSGTSIPKLTGGIITNFAYKNFSLSLNFYYQVGGKMYDVVYSNLMAPGTGSLSYSKMHVDALKSWKKPGDVTKVPKISNGSDAKNLYAASTRWLISSDMLELTTINVGYKCPKKMIKKLGVTGLRLYFSAENMFQMTKRKGIYPRRDIFSGYSSNVDIYLPSRVFTFGLNVSF